jgi:hypothetical protein
VSFVGCQDDSEAVSKRAMVDFAQCSGGIGFVVRLGCGSRCGSPSMAGRSSTYTMADHRTAQHNDTNRFHYMV